MSPRKKLLAAIAVGVVLAGPPVASLNLWLNGVVERQAYVEAETFARRSMTLSEARIVRALNALSDLAARGVDSCRSAHIDALRQTTFVTTPVKEFSIIAPDGRTLCTDRGTPPEQRKLLSSELIDAGGTVFLETMALESGQGRLVRVRRMGSSSANGIAAVIPSELFIAQLSAQGEPLQLRGQIATASGAVLARSAQPQGASERSAERLEAVFASHRFPLIATLSVPRSGVGINQSDFNTVGILATAALAIMILLVSLLLIHRQRGNPVAELQRAMNAGEFVPYYQPIVDIRSGRLRGAEVLMRWRHPDGSVDAPGTFIPLAESTGLIIDMTRNLMRRVCLDLGAAFAARPHLKISFNLTARHFTDEQIVADVQRIFNKASPRLSQIVLEVTERQPLDNFTETRRVIAALQGLGVRIAIDDVGTGHSGLSYMLKLGADIIKIDKVFVDSLGTDLNSNTIIETLIDLANNMRMEVIAEGVESFEQVVNLRDLGIRAAQGYVFAPPLPTSAFLQLVEAIDPLKDAAAKPTAAVGPVRASA